MCFYLDGVHGGEKLKKETVGDFFFYEYLGNHVYQLWESFLLENSGVEQFLSSYLTLE